MRVGRPFVRRARVDRRYFGHRQDHTCQSALKNARLPFQMYLIHSRPRYRRCRRGQYLQFRGSRFRILRGIDFQRDRPGGRNQSCLLPNAFRPSASYGRAASHRRRRNIDLAQTRFYPSDTQYRRNGRYFPVAKSIARPLLPMILRVIRVPRMKVRCWTALVSEATLSKSRRSHKHSKSRMRKRLSIKSASAISPRTIFSRSSMHRR